jgi:hypothetical protein
VVAPQCSTNADCDDGRVCNGVERCGADRQCVPGTPVACDDGVSCTRDQCLEPSGSCTSMPDDALCPAGARCGDGEAWVGCRSVCPSGNPDVCDTLLQCGCGEGQGCYVGVLPAACAPAGTGVHGEPCPLRQCAPGNHCVDVGLGGSGSFEMCRENCREDSDCPSGGRCAFEVPTQSGGASGTGFCSYACDVVRQTGCPAGTGCHPFDGGTRIVTDCVVMGTTPAGRACTTPEQCEVGSLCIAFSDGRRCARLCRSSTTCTRRCVFLAEPLRIDGVEHGVCE